MDNNTITEEHMSKDNIKESDAVEEQALKKDESEHKLFSIYTNLMLRFFLLSTGLVMFISAFLKAIKISGFNASKLILLEICILVLLVFIVGVSVALAKMRHESKVKGAISVLLYFAALISIVSFLLVWAFFKATPV